MNVCLQTPGLTGNRRFVYRSNGSPNLTYQINGKFLMLSQRMDRKTCMLDCTFENYNKRMNI